MATEPAGAPTQIGQDGRGVIGQTVIGATVIYGSVTIIQGPKSQEEGQPPQSVPEAEDDGPNPYQGLLAFQPGDGDRFFGREGETEELRQRFCALHHEPDATRLLVVFGPSGSGKSSLVRAGLVPALAKRPPGGQAQACIALLVPGSQPLHALAAVLARIATNDPAPASKSREFAEELAITNGDGAHDGLRRLAALLPEADVWPLVVVVDQLEEIYSLCNDEGARQAFLANLLAAAADPAGRVAVVMTLRSDFLGATQAEPALNTLIKTQGVFVAGLAEAGLRDAIRRPALQRGRPLDDAVVDLLVKESLGRDGALPLLQFGLMRIWEGMRQGQSPVHTLRAIGGVGGALAGEADQLHQSLSPDEQRIAQRLFLSLVQLGEGSSDSRRRVLLTEVIAHGEDPAAVRRVIKCFADPNVRLITRSSAAGDQREEETLELSHEALIEAWPRLQDWLTTDRDDLRFQRRLEEAARLWDDAQRPEGRLWRPPDLNLLERFRESRDADLTPRQLAFAEACRKAERSRTDKEQRTQALLRGGLVALSGLTVLALGSGGLAWHQLRQAQAAQSMQFRATHQALLDNDSFSSLVYGLAAARDLLDSRRSWEAAELSATLITEAAKPTLAMPIATDQGSIFNLIELKNGEVASSGRDGTIRRWRDGKPVGVPIETGQKAVMRMIEHSNGEVISCGWDGTVKRWRNWKPIGGSIVISKGGECSLVELRNAEVIAITSDGMMTRLRDGMPIESVNGVPILIELSSGELLGVELDGVFSRWKDWNKVGQSIPTGISKITVLTQLRNGEVVSGEANGTLRRWRDEKPVGPPIRTGQVAISSLIERSNGEVITGGADGSIRRWRDGKPVGQPIATGQGRVISLIELNTGDVISGGEDGSLRRLRNGFAVAERNTITSGQEGVKSLIRLGNNEVITGGWNGTVRRWRDGKPAGNPITISLAPVDELIELKNGEVMSMNDGRLVRWRVGQVVYPPIATGQEDIASLIELGNGTVISGGTDGTLRRWRDGKAIGKPIVTGQKVVMSLLELNNDEIISAGSDGTLRRWRDGKAIGKPIASGLDRINILMKLANGEMISAGLDGTLRRWRDGKAIGKPIATGQDVVTSLLELNNGEIISGGYDGTLRRWRDGRPMGDGKPIYTGHWGVWGLVEMKNGELLSGGREGTLRLWSLRSVVASICRSLDFSYGNYPPAMEPAKAVARETCQIVGIAK
jgi:WD40 repeat protein